MPTNIPTSKPPSDHAHQAPPGHPALALLRKKIDVDLLHQWLGHCMANKCYIIGQRKEHMGQC